MKRWILIKLKDIASKYGLVIPDDKLEYTLAFGFLIEVLGEESGVVILVDEYEKVITENIYNEYSDLMREVLSDFYIMIKSLNQIFEILLYYWCNKIYKAIYILKDE